MLMKQPTEMTLEQLHPDELQTYLRRFLRFSYSPTHEFTRPSKLCRRRFPRMLPAVSQQQTSSPDFYFYQLPLDLLIGIGAMENNYMNVPGDLNNTAWKRRADAGDIVLSRERHRVLVLNDSTGVWQITKQSLRYAQRLYSVDKRDYSLLPERLRPPKSLDVNNVDPDVLTTYAGLLLRNLLDRFHGDTGKAVGAYNGGVDKPNLQYAAGVQIVAAYARTVIERAASLHSAAVARGR